MDPYPPPSSMTLSPQSPPVGQQPSTVFRPRRSDDWHEYREIIEQLYRNDQLKLRDVKRIMERDYKFYASYRSHFLNFPPFFLLFPGCLPKSIDPCGLSYDFLISYFTSRLALSSKAMDLVLFVLLICFASLFPCNPQLLIPIITRRPNIPSAEKNNTKTASLHGMSAKTSRLRKST